LDETTAKAIIAILTEVVIAPDATPEAQQVLAKKPNIRLLLTGGLLDQEARPLNFRSVSGGVLVQQADVTTSAEFAGFKVVTERTPTKEEEADLIFAMSVAKHVRSNAIVFAKAEATLGVGAGQMSRVDSVRLAIWKAREIAAAAQKDAGSILSGSVVASDA